MIQIESDIWETKYIDRKDNSEFDESDNHNEYREELIIELERIINNKSFKLTRFEKKRLVTIIYDSDLNLPYNQRECLRKKYSEVESDYQYYKNLAKRAENIITIINNEHNSIWLKTKKMFNL